MATLRMGIAIAKNLTFLYYYALPEDKVIVQVLPLLEAVRFAKIADPLWQCYSVYPSLLN